MKKVISTTLCTMLCAILFLGASASAQDLYVGLGVAPSTNADDSTLGVNAQVGVGLLPALTVRGSAETSLNFSQFRLASADLLYNFGLPLTGVKVYVGAGADVFFEEQPDEISDVRNGPFGAHAVGGGEFRIGRLGVFGEVQPGLLINGFDPYIRARAGVNLHF